MVRMTWLIESLMVSLLLLLGAAMLPLPWYAKLTGWWVRVFGGHRWAAATPELSGVHAAVPHPRGPHDVSVDAPRPGELGRHESARRQS
jgi:hypothetical protein